jgi:hypothetical protein
MFGKYLDMSMLERVDLFGCKQPLQRDECSELEDYFFFTATSQPNFEGD